MKIRKLKDFCKVISGQSPKGTSYNTEGYGMEFHQGKKCFGENSINISNVWTKEITKIAEPGDILMSVRAPVGPTNFTDRQVCIGRGLAAIRCSERVLPKFILYSLKNIECKITGNDGAVFNSINKDMIEDLPVPDLSLPEQDRIVKKLDEAFAKIDALKQNVEKGLQAVKDLWQATLKEELKPKEGWQMKTVEEITVDIYRGAGITKNQVTENGIPCVRYGEIYTKYNYSFDSCRSHTKEDSIKSRKYFEHGDLLFAITGESVEDIAKCIAYTGHDKCLAGGDIVVLKHKQEPRYLSYALLTPDAVKQKGLGKTKLKVVHSNVPSIKAIRIPLAPIKEQKEIADKLDNIRSIIKRYEEFFANEFIEYEALKQSILRKAFSGEL